MSTSEYLYAELNKALDEEKENMEIEAQDYDTTELREMEIVLTVMLKRVRGMIKTRR